MEVEDDISRTTITNTASEAKYTPAKSVVAKSSEDKHKFNPVETLAKVSFHPLKLQIIIQLSTMSAFPVETSTTKTCPSKRAQVLISCGKRNILDFILPSPTSSRPPPSLPRSMESLQRSVARCTCATERSSWCTVPQNGGPSTQFQKSQAYQRLQQFF